MRELTLIERRNKKLCERYAYWTERKRRRFDDVIEILSTQEFFLTPATIERYLRDNSDYLSKCIEKEHSRRCA